MIDRASHLKLNAKIADLSDQPFTEASLDTPTHFNFLHQNIGHLSYNRIDALAAVAEWYRYRTVACFVTSSSPVPLKTAVLLLGEVVVVVMGIGNKVSLCIVGNIADVEGMEVEGTSLDIGILGVGGWDSDIVAVEEDVIDDLAAWEYVCDKGRAINFRASKVQSVEECPTDAPLEHISCPQQEVGE
ncbi:hypothetical protein TNCV_5047951 [Trichonephila clavipes]|nr:hypothetical protein TNCV_5047951 [Trichonephila clavipes]